MLSNKLSQPCPKNWLYLQRLCCAVISCLICFLSSSCGGGEPDLIEIGNPVEVTGTFAYVEDVVFDEDIRSGDIVRFTVIVSMAQNTETLYGTAEYGISSFVSYVVDEDGLPLGIAMDSSMKGPFSASAPRHDYKMAPLPLDAGEYTLFILSADSREAGGLMSDIQLTPIHWIDPHPNLILREFPFTVLPAEDAAAE